MYVQFVISLGLITGLINTTACNISVQVDSVISSTLYSRFSTCALHYTDTNPPHDISLDRHVA